MSSNDSESLTLKGRMFLLAERHRLTKAILADKSALANGERISVKDRRAMRDSSLSRQEHLRHLEKQLALAEAKLIEEDNFGSAAHPKSKAS